MHAHRRIAAIALAVTGLLAPGAMADDLQEIKKLIPSAAAMSKADYVKLATAKTLTKTDDFADKSLTLMLFALPVPADRTEEQKSEFDYLGERVPKPSDLAKEIHRGRFVGGVSLALAPVTFIHANRITDITCEVAGDKATGTVTFEVSELYQGKVNYVAQRNDDAWQINEFSLPAHKLHIVRGEDDKWREKK